VIRSDIERILANIRILEDRPRGYSRSGEKMMQNIELINVWHDTIRNSTGLCLDIARDLANTIILDSMPTESLC
jgi:hypothetical protein